MLRRAASRWMLGRSCGSARFFSSSGAAASVAPHAPHAPSPPPAPPLSPASSSLPPQLPAAAAWEEVLAAARRDPAVLAQAAAALHDHHVRRGGGGGAGGGGGGSGDPSPPPLLALNELLRLSTLHKQPTTRDALAVILSDCGLGDEETLSLLHDAYSYFPATGLPPPPTALPPSPLLLLPRRVRRWPAHPTPLPVPPRARVDGDDGEGARR